MTPPETVKNAAAESEYRPAITEKAALDLQRRLFILILDSNVQLLSRRHRLVALPNM